MRSIIITTFALALTFACASCSKDDDIIDDVNVPVELTPSSLTLDLAVDKGSLPDEYVKQLFQVTVIRPVDQSSFPDVQTFVEKGIVEPMQEKINEIAAKSGCYDFSVTITAYDINEPTKVVYTTTLKPVKQ